MAVVINGTTGIDKVQDGSIGTADIAADAITGAKLATNITVDGTLTAGAVAVGGTGSANTLDDYEEGVWTPDVLGTGVSWSYRAGVYTKVGRTVTLTFWLQASSTDSTSGTVSIIGLPFVTNSIGRNTVSVRAYALANLPSGIHTIVGWTSGGGASVAINAVTGAITSGTQLNRNVWQNGSEIHFTLVYQTA